MAEGSFTFPATVPTQTQPEPAKGDVTTDGGTTKITVDTTPTPADKKTEGARPAWLPEKFKTAEELAASYSELEKKLGGSKPTTDAPAADPTKAVSADDMAAINAEFAKDGKLSDATYKSLAGKGFSKDAVDQHIAGQKALVEKYTAAVHEAVGGTENFTKIEAWAGANLNDAELGSINAVLAKGDAALSKTVLEGLKARYDKAVGTDPNLVSGGAQGTGTAGVQPFKSDREITDAMGGKNAQRYRNDPAYRKSVEARLAVTQTFNS